jgi:hypothetical protein
VRKSTANFHPNQHPKREVTHNTVDVSFDNLSVSHLQVYQTEEQPRSPTFSQHKVDFPDSSEM